MHQFLLSDKKSTSISLFYVMSKHGIYKQYKMGEARVLLSSMWFGSLTDLNRHPDLVPHQFELVHSEISGSGWFVTPWFEC